MLWEGAGASLPGPFGTGTGLLIANVQKLLSIISFHSIRVQSELKYLINYIISMHYYYSYFFKCSETKQIFE